MSKLVTTKTKKKMPWSIIKCPDKQYLLNVIKTLDPEHEIFEVSIIDNVDL